MGDILVLVLAVLGGLIFYFAAKEFKTGEDSREDKWADYEHRKRK